MRCMRLLTTQIVEHDCLHPTERKPHLYRGKHVQNLGQPSSCAHHRCQNGGDNFALEETLVMGRPASTDLVYYKATA